MEVVSGGTARFSESQLSAAELGFRQLLRRKRFSRQFVDNHSADLMAKAEFEYSRHLARGGEVTNPTGWLINCAWRRTQNLLEEQSRSPRMVGVDAVGPLVDESAPTPEQQVLDADRARRVRHAINALSVEERQVIELCYFEGMSVREVGRVLKWDKSKADRRHRSALERVREVLGVDDVDSLAIDLGLAAYVSLAGNAGTVSKLGIGHPALTNGATHGISELVARANDLARRFLLSGGGEPSSAAVASGTARAAGACGAAALACLATGVVGPGVGGLNLVSSGHSKPVVHRIHRGFEAPPAIASPEPVLQPTPYPSNATNGSVNASKAHASSPSSERQQAPKEFDPFATGAGSGSSGTSTSTSSGATASSSSSSPASPPAPSKPHGAEFGL